VIGTEDGGADGEGLATTTRRRVRRMLPVMRVGRVWLMQSPWIEARYCGRFLGRSSSLCLITWT
jgi:hypothetical protein